MEDIFYNHENILFYSALTTLIIHEMDAIRCEEWKIIPGLSLFNEEIGFKVFILSHIPLFIILFIGLSSSYYANFIFWLDWFFIIHFFLHLIFLLHKNNKFKDWISWTLISGTAIFGFLDIL